MLTALGVIGLLAWIYLLVFHHGFWKGDQRLGHLPDPATWPGVTAVVPARNEAPSIAACVEALAKQDYPGPFRVVVVDDSSTDGTGDIARSAAADADTQVEVITAPPLEAGWSGKLWALSQGVDAAGDQNELLWFTDADVVHGPGVLRQLVAKAENDDRDLVSLMVRLHCSTFWEKLLVPAFIFFFQMLYPFPAVNDPKSRIAGAAGGCVLIRRAALERIGGIAAIREALIDDCTLAAAIKGTGGRIWLGLANHSRSLRQATGLGDLWHMVTRTAFTQLGYSVWLLAGTVLGLSLIFLVPPLLVLTLPAHNQWVAALCSAAAWTAVALAYRPTLKDYGQSPLAGLLLPLVAALYTAMTLHSAINHWIGASSRWKGRTYLK